MTYRQCDGTAVTDRNVALCRLTDRAITQFLSYMGFPAHAGNAVGQLQQKGDALRIQQAWPEPNSGYGTEYAYCGEDGNTLHVDSTIHSNGQTVSYKSIYRRRL
jgi:hypothetical protein